MVENTGLLGDKYEELGYKFEELSGIIVNDKKMTHPDWSKQIRVIQDQGLNEKTWYYCTAYGTSHATDALQGELLPTFRTGEILGDEAVKEKLLDPKKGAYGLDIVKLAKKYGMIKGFAQVEAKASEIEKALEVGPVVGGSNKINWKKTTKIAIYGAAYGHFFCIVQALPKEKLFKCINSYGTRKNDKGYFYIKYEDVNKMLFRGLWVLSVIPELALIPDWEKQIISDKKKRVPVPKDYQYLTDQKDIDVNTLNYFRNKNTMGPLEFRCYQIAYRRAYKMKEIFN